MEKSYCTQNAGDCATCSLVNYGLDCANNPIARPRPRGNKRSRAMANYNGHKGSATIAHVESNIDVVYPDAYAELTGVQYGKLMSIANTSYHDGKASAGAELSDGLLMILRGEYHSIPEAVARMITVETERVTTWEPTTKTSLRGGGNDKYVLRNGEYVRIDLSRETTDEQLYYRNDDYVSVVRYKGIEIDRINGVI